MTPLAGLYGIATRARRAAYDRGLLRAACLPGVTISVGNLTAGGTGKTPVVLELARLLCAAGARPAILTRGYGAGMGKGEGVILVDGAVLAVRGGFAAKRLPDEALLLSQSLPGVPVLAGADRRASAAQFAALTAPQPTHWLLDDGFQHRQIARDLDLVLLDARQPLGNGALLPRGLLREPPAALARADAVLFTRAGAGFPDAAARAELAAFCAGPVGEARFITEVPADLPPAGEILLAAGIAAPERLQAAVEAALGRPIRTHFVRDHAAFDEDALRAAARGASVVLTTAKDHWRDPAVFAACARPVRLLELRLDGAREFLQALLGKLASRRP